jgi:hypothetical protein
MDGLLSDAPAIHQTAVAGVKVCCLDGLSRMAVHMLNVCCCVSKLLSAALASCVTDSFPLEQDTGHGRASATRAFIIMLIDFLFGCWRPAQFGNSKLGDR